MAENNQFLSVIRIWAAVAWADGVIADNERLAMERLIKTAPLSTEHRSQAMALLDERLELESLELAGLSHDSRLGVYRAAARLAAVDQEVAAEEKSILSRLRDALGITSAEAEAIEAEIPGHG